MMSRDPFDPLRCGLLFVALCGFALAVPAGDGSPARATGGDDAAASEPVDRDGEDRSSGDDETKPSTKADVEIVVTASFRDTVARDVPASVVVLDESTVRETSARHFEELSLQVPNLHYSGEGNRARYWQIRGVGEREQYTGAPDPSVGFFIDDVDFSGIGAIATLWDVDRVEVLRGPQGTRFGASALAGMIYVRSAPPPDEFRFDAETSVDRGGGRLGFAVGAPLARDGSLAYRLAVDKIDSDGYRDNVHLGRDDTHGRDETTVRGKLRWRPSYAWTVDLTGFWIDLDDGYDAFTIDNDRTTESDRPGRDAQRTVAGSIRATGAVSDTLRIVAISSAADSDGTFSFDADWGNPDLWAPYTYDFFSATDRRRRTISQEIRLMSPADGPWGGRLSWVVGAYASRLTETNRTRDDGLYVDPAFPDDPFVLDASIAREFEADTAALFGEAAIDVSARSTVTVGIRAERRDASYRDTAGDAFDPTETLWGGQVAWLRELGPTVNLYARVARGYKAGGFNLGLPAEAPAGSRTFDAEVLWNHEIGFKGRTRDGRAAWDVVAFWSDRRDQQVETSSQLDPSNPTTFVFFTDNAGRGHNAGVEASGSMRIGRALRVHGAAGWLDTEIDAFGTDTRIEGRDQPHAPRLSYAAGAVWRDARGRFARVDVTGKSSYYFDTSHDRRSDPFTLVHVRAGFERERWAVFVWARNVFDERYAVRGFYFGNEPPDFPLREYVKLGDPRRVGVTLRYAR